MTCLRDVCSVHLQDNLNVVPADCNICNVTSCLQPACKLIVQDVCCESLLSVAEEVKEPYPATDVLLEKLKEVLQKADMEVC